MLNELRTFFDHSRHKLWVRNVGAVLDVLAFEGEEGLSRPFKYRVELTSTDGDIAAEQMLGQDARFSLHTAPHKLPVALPGLSTPEVKPLRLLYGVITAFKRLSSSNDQACYEVTLEPRLALLGRGKQFRIYQHQSVPEIVESILRGRHDFEGQDFLFKLVRDYPKREQVMQYDESDLAFIARLLAEVGIWYRFTSDERLSIDVVEFHDDQRHYAKPPVELPYRPQSGLGSTGQDGVWKLQSSHQVVERHVNIRTYHHRDASAWLDGEVDQTRGAKTTYGEAYLYAEPYRVLGDPILQDEDLQSESGYFYARLRHERYLNGQTQLSGASSSATLAPGQQLNITGGAPRAFASRAVIIQLTTRAARDSSLEATFEAIPYSETVCFRPPLLDKPKMAGTVPARVTSPQANDPYGHIDLEGRYKVNFLFDRDSWKPGQESLWLRLARPYAGDIHGLHLPLIPGTEVAVAFEQGDPDRPYIAHALHDSRHPDHVTLGKRNYTRNVLRTPANNKLRMEDRRGQEHVKLSTEYAGKSQLNLGHLVDAEKQKRGEGAELRTDGHAAIRGGSGIFISADKQSKAQGEMLSMREALAQLEEALQRVQGLARNAAATGALEADSAVPEHLKGVLGQLKEAGFLVSAPAGMALVTPEHLQLAAGQTFSAVNNNTDFSVLKRFTVAAGHAIGLFAQKLGMKFIANQGAVSIQAQNDRMELLARQGLDISSTEDEIRITAKKKITLNSGSNYITLDPYRIEIGSPGEVEIKSPHFDYIQTAARLKTAPVPMAEPLGDEPNRLLLNFFDAMAQPIAGVPYVLTFDNGQVLQGHLDEQGHALHRVVPESPARVQYQLPEPEPDQPWPSYVLLMEAQPSTVQYPTQASGPGVWVTQEYDYLGMANLAIGLLNRVTSMGDQGRVFGSDGRDLKNTMRDVIQEWQPLPEDAPLSLLQTSMTHTYGETRRIRQQYLEGDDQWAISGSSWYWKPVIANKVFEVEE
ncbi:type VI secretion system Vgr family protein [Pseudomonas sp. MWU13-2100]|uniref:type VI secretion system Vgr family protein n=1 Tax=Pseudomonas sp. MWU13-2100 TaxID=2935075 RepID=UPI00200D5B6F|nr:type VI secretion system Vgr family protein [Pseudomonas sp. MWU13-2100]